MNHLVFEVGLALSLVAGAALLALRLRISNAPILILAGMAVGPHAPKIGMLDLRFIESAELIEFMGRLGVLFLLFYLGLEFSVGRLFKAGRSIATGGTIYIWINLIAGLLFGLALGWPFEETLVVAGITTISSSAIVAKVLFDLRRTANPETELILGIVMIEDIFFAFYLSLVSGIVLSGATSTVGVLGSAGIALAFILGILLIGRLAVPILNRAFRIGSNEAFLLVIFSSLFLLAGFGETIHVAEAIGALLVGLVLAETDARRAHRAIDRSVPRRLRCHLLLRIRPFDRSVRTWRRRCAGACGSRPDDCWQRGRRNARRPKHGACPCRVAQRRSHDRLTRRVLDRHGQPGEVRRPAPGPSALRGALCSRSCSARSAHDSRIGANLQRDRVSARSASCISTTWSERPGTRMTGFG